MMKKVLSVVLALTFIFSAVPLSGVADFVKGIDFSFLSVKSNAASVIDSGACGYNVYWYLYSDNYLLIDGKGAMYDYHTSYYIPQGLQTTAPWNSYYNSIKTVEIGSDVTSIGEYVFYYFTSLTSVTIPESVTSIGDYAFCGCKSLTSVTIPDSVTSIGEYAFTGCTSLTSITIPDSVTGIGAAAFGNTGYYNNSSNWENNVLYIGNHLIDVNTSISGAYEIKPGTKTVAACAFNECGNLTGVTIPDSVTSIGMCAFEHCGKITSITIPDSVTSIGGGAFSYTDYYNNSDNWENNALYIGNHLIAADSSITGFYKIKDGTKTIAGGAFSCCKSLTSVTIPDSVKSIGDKAFYECTSLTIIKIPNSVTSIGKSAFEDCTSLPKIIIPDGVPRIGNSAFRRCSKLTSISIPDSVESIGSYAFEKCTSLTSITLLDGVTSIGNKAFSYCTSLASVTIPNSVMGIGEWAFEDCTSLTSVTIPDGVVSIDMYAFEDCTSLASVTISNYVMRIGKGAFSCCKSLKSIAIPDNVWRIESKTFYNCTSLKTATIGNGVISIGENAFEYCTSLRNINIPNGVTRIEEAAFRCCSSIRYINIPDSVTSIGERVFGGCSSLISIVIPESVMIIGADAFAGCNNLTVYCYEDSYAYYYAENNSLSYVFICEHKHTVNYGGRPATCTEYGFTAGVYCDDCGEILSGCDFIEKTPHTYNKGICTACGDWQYKNTVLALGKITNQNGSVKLTWSTVTGATGYNVYRKAGSATSWSKLATVTTLTYTDKNVKTGTKYTYTVKPICGSVSGKYNTTGISTYYLAQPTVKAANQNGSVKVTWGNISGAKSYIVYRKAGSATSWSKVATITTNAYTDKSVKSGTNYTYTVKAVNGSYASAYNTKGVVTKYLAQPTLGTPVSAKAGVTVKWGKVAGATGYIVYRKTGSGSYAKIATVKGNTTVSYLDKSAKKGTTYTYTVKAYYSSYYSAYNTKGVSIKDKY